MNYDKLTERDILDLVKSKAVQISTIGTTHVNAEKGEQIASLIDDLTKLGADIRARIAEMAAKESSI